MADETQTAGKRSAWLTHVKKTMKAHKGMKLKAVLKIVFQARWCPFSPPPQRWSSQDRPSLALKNESEMH
jgi:hypothetical protein